MKISIYVGPHLVPSFIEIAFSRCVLGSVYACNITGHRLSHPAPFQLMVVHVTSAVCAGAHDCGDGELQSAGC